MQILLLSIGLLFPLAIILLRKILAPQFTLETKQIISLSFNIATKLKLKEIPTDLILYAIAKNEVGVACQLLKYQNFKAEIFIRDFEIKPVNELNEDFKLIELTTDAQDCLTKAAANAIKNRSNVNSAYILKAIVTSNSITTISDKYQIPNTELIELTLKNPEVKALEKLEKAPSVIERIKQDFF